MRKIFLIIPAVFLLILTALGIGVYKYKYQPAAKTKEIFVSPAELAEAEKIERFLLPPRTASVSAQVARERVTKRKILEWEIPDFKIDSNTPAFAPDGRIFPQDLAATYNYDRLLTEAVRQKVEGNIKIDIVSVKFVKPELKNQAEKVAMGATPSAGITVSRFSQTLIGETAKKFQSDAKPVFENSPMGMFWIFRTVTNRDNGLGITLEEWLKKQ